MNHLPEREFYHELDLLKKKQQQLTEPKEPIKKKRPKSKSDKCSSRASSHHFDHFICPNDYETKRNITERISFADDGNSICSWQLDFDGSITCKKRDNLSRLSSATSRPRTSRTESHCRKQTSRLSNIQDDYELLNSLKNYRSKSISPTRSQLNDSKYQKELEGDAKFYSDLTYDKLKAVDHTIKRDPIKDIPITSRIPLFKKVMEDKEHKSQLARLNSAIKLQSQMKPFHFYERSNARSSSRRCLSRSLSTPQLGNCDFSDNEDVDSTSFKAKPFPKNLFCNFFHYKMWEDNYFRALNKKLRAEELLKISKFPPSMAKREEEKKKNEAIDELEQAQAVTPSILKQSVEFSPILSKKKRMRKKLRKTKSAIASSRSQFAKSYIFDTKRDRDKGSVKSDTTATTMNTLKHRETPSDNITPIYPVNRPNLAATLRYEWSREKIKHYKETKEMLMRDKFRRPSWGVKNTHAFQQLAHEASNDEEIALRLATRKAEQKLRQEEHELNMEMMKQRVKTAPLLLEGPTQLAPRLGHIYHNCDIADDKKKLDGLIQQNNLLKVPVMHHKSNRPGSTISSTDSKRSESTYNTKTT
ncbi:unnamed protein product [Chironomus riparius]|uniref:Uncharacterized protein n=1 Tax=Chironomus riparius TaxID=315576 RepID=A0A9N9WNK6_9DIPT|nr:unnamed protein product [Chironomus riparius]